MKRFHAGEDPVDEIGALEAEYPYGEQVMRRRRKKEMMDLVPTD